jgi:hypothetical protein
MDKVSHGTIAGVSQSSIFCFTINRTLANDHIIFLFHLHFFGCQYYSSDEVKKMGSAGQVVRRGRGEMHTGLWLGDLRAWKT